MAGSVTLALIHNAGGLDCPPKPVSEFARSTTRTEQTRAETLRGLACTRHILPVFVRLLQLFRVFSAHNDCFGPLR